VRKQDLRLLEALEAVLAPPLDAWAAEEPPPPEDLPGPEMAPDLDPRAGSARGPLSRGEYCHGKKWPQIRWFLRRLRAFDAFSHVLDVGGGRGDLAMQIAAAFDARVTVVDVNDPSLQAGREAAAKRHLAIDFMNLDFGDEGSRERLPAVDMVVALHACGGLSDAVLEFARQRQVPFLVCPCCHLKHQHLEPANGWSSLLPFLAKETGPNPPEEAQTLRQLAELDRRDISFRALKVIAALRLQAIGWNQRLRCTLGMFPEEFSQRNLVIIGERT
ncbi:unnamed protein product, partial [Effrenium voratum]